MDNDGLISMNVTVLPDGRMDVENASAYVGLKPKTLALMRCDGSGSKFVKLGRIFYFKEDLDDGVERCQSTAQARFHQSSKTREA